MRSLTPLMGLLLGALSVGTAAGCAGVRVHAAPDPVRLAPLPGITVAVPGPVRPEPGQGIDSDVATFIGAGYRITFDRGMHGGLPDLAGASIQPVPINGVPFERVAGSISVEGVTATFALKQVVAGARLYLTVSGRCRTRTICEAVERSVRTSLRLGPTQR